MAALIQREFGVSYHPAEIPRLRRAVGGTPQQPVTQASQREEQKIDQCKADGAEVKKGRTRKGALSSG
jgi:transposase